MFRARNGIVKTRTSNKVRSARFFTLCHQHYSSVNGLVLANTSAGFRCFLIFFAVFRHTESRMQAAEKKYYFVTALKFLTALIFNRH